MRATQLVYEAAGRPDPRKPLHPVESGTCYWCGGALGGRACRQADVCGDTFTGHDEAAVPESPWVCAGCTWALTGRPPDTLRLWSVLWVDQTWLREDERMRLAPSHGSAPALGPEIHLNKKSDLSEFDRILRHPPHGRWACSITDSGKLHVFPFAVVNHGSDPWCVRYERVDVHSDPAEYGRVADAVVAALAAGYFKSELLSEPFPSRMAKVGIEAWRSFERAVERHRGGVLLELAVFLTKNPNKE